MAHNRREPHPLARIGERIRPPPFISSIFFEIPARKEKPTLLHHIIIDKADTDVDLNVNVPTEEIGVLVDKIRDGVVTIVVAITVSAIVRRWMGNPQ